mgnify:CR=1 FL=1|jgi:uncharacterized protein
MKLPDVNIWIALALSGHSFHAVARKWLDAESLPGSIFFCRASQQGLMRLLTTEAVLAPYGIPALTNRAAWEIGEQFLADDRIAFAPEPDGVEAMWKAWAGRDMASPKLWMDAWLAAFALQSRFQLVTIDKGFAKFEGLNAHILGRTPGNSDEPAPGDPLRGRDF